MIDRAKTGRPGWMIDEAIDAENRRLGIATPPWPFSAIPDQSEVELFVEKARAAGGGRVRIVSEEKRAAERERLDRLHAAKLEQRSTAQQRVSDPITEGEQAMPKKGTKKKSAPKASKTPAQPKAHRAGAGGHKTPRVGSKFTRERDGKTHELEVVYVDAAGRAADAGAGNIRYRLDGGTDYLSPSGAAKAITKCEVNGWTYWRIA